MITVYFSGLFGNIQKGLRKVQLKQKSSICQLKEMIASKITELHNNNTPLYPILGGGQIIQSAVPDGLNLVFRSVLLKNSQTLDKVGIINNSIVTVVRRRTNFGIKNENDKLKATLRFLLTRPFPDYLKEGLRQEKINIKNTLIERQKNKHYSMSHPVITYSDEDRFRMQTENNSLRDTIEAIEKSLDASELETLKLWETIYSIHQKISLYKRSSPAPPSYDYKGALGLFKTYVIEI